MPLSASHAIEAKIIGFLIMLLLWGLTTLIGKLRASSVRMQADKALAEGRADEAIKAYSAALVKSPADTIAMLGRGQAYGLAGRHKNALTDFNGLLRVQKGDLDGLWERGRTLIAIGSLEAARADIEAFRQKAPDAARGWQLAGVLELARGNTSGAVEMLTTAIARNATNARSRLYRAEAYRRLGDVTAAEADETAALRLDPAARLDPAMLPKLPTAAPQPMEPRTEEAVVLHTPVALGRAAGVLLSPELRRAA